MQDLIYLSQTPTQTSSLESTTEKILLPNLSLWQMLYHELRAIGYTQRYIARVSGISVSTIKKLQRSTQRRPTVKTFYRLMLLYCKCLGGGELSS